MIWRWVICFSLLASALRSASVRGQITIIADKSAKRSTDEGGTIVWLNPLDSGRAASVRPVKAEIRQRNKTFEPHLLAVPLGSTIAFPNLDPIFHNAFSNYDGQMFDIGLYPPGSIRNVTFKRAGVVRVFCNIHSTMSAVIVVLTSPYFSETGRDGRFQLDGVPEGRYRLMFYYERATEKTLNDLARDVQIGEAPVDLGNISLSGSGYLSVPHLNKYGKPYSASSDAATYPGARQ